MYFTDRNTDDGKAEYQRISEIHKSYDPLQYPLMFPCGSDGYHVNILHSDNTEKRVTAAQFYLFRLMVRENNYLLQFGQLLNVYIVDMYAKIESERLLYIRFNQEKLRVEEYVHLRDAYLDEKSNVEDVGKMVILPSSFTGTQ